MDALTGRRIVRYSKRNARIEIPYHVLERLIARDLKLQQIELQKESHSENQPRQTFPVFVDAEYASGEKRFATPVSIWPGKISIVPKHESNIALCCIHFRVGDDKFSIELH